MAAMPTNISPIFLPRLRSSFGGGLASPWGLGFSLLDEEAGPLVEVGHEAAADEEAEKEPVMEMERAEEVGAAAEEEEEEEAAVAEKPEAAEEEAITEVA
ncbi:hypothetical protein RJ640_008424 [Escallonia rubra]|uniref:Uncharacterized protein n=1 Tax=Escallonia rubra TaxID=112253 RepID=A0AA88SGR1_9ASTE|nr:hypothetical protein RJ640_008424 [Escallonia rubra]